MQLQFLSYSVSLEKPPQIVKTDTAWNVQNFGQFFLLVSSGFSILMGKLASAWPVSLTWRLSLQVTLSPRTMNTVCSWLDYNVWDTCIFSYNTIGKVGKVCIWAKWPIRPELIPVSVAWRDWEYFYSPLDGMLVHRRVTPSIKFAGTHLYTLVERGTMRVKCLAQEHNTMSLARAQTQTARSGVKRTNHEHHGLEINN